VEVDVAEVRAVYENYKLSMAVGPKGKDICRRACRVSKVSACI
jgi:hypothetical protein